MLLRLGWELKQDVGSAHAQQAAAVLRSRGRRGGYWGRGQNRLSGCAVGSERQLLTAPTHHRRPTTASPAGTPAEDRGTCPWAASPGWADMIDLSLAPLVVWRRIATQVFSFSGLGLTGKRRSSGDWSPAIFRRHGRTKRQKVTRHETGLPAPGDTHHVIAMCCRIKETLASRGGRRGGGSGRGIWSQACPSCYLGEQKRACCLQHCPPAAPQTR